MTTLVLQPDGAAGLDTYLETNLPNANFGANAQFYVGDNNTIADIMRTLIKFDLSAIPADAHIDTATLTLKVMADLSSNARTFRVYRQLRPWVELEATWNIYKAATNWATAGGFGVADCEQTDIGSHAFTAAEAVNSTHDFVLSAWAIQQMITGGGFTNNGFMIKADTEVDDSYGFYSSDHGVAVNRPMLTITWSPVMGRLPAYIVDGLQGGITLKATIEQFANEVWVRHTPVGGALTRTPAAHSIDLASKTKFGQKDQPLSGGAASVTIADQIADTYLGFQSSPNMPDITIAPGTVIRDQNGNVVPHEEIRPNNWMLIENLALPTGLVFSSLTQNPMALYIEEVAFSEESGLGITAGRDRFTQALVARIAGRGGG